LDFFSILENHFQVDNDFATSGIPVESDIKETEINIMTGDKDKAGSI